MAPNIVRHPRRLGLMVAVALVVAGIVTITTAVIRNPTEPQATFIVEATDAPRAPEPVPAPYPMSVPQPTPAGVIHPDPEVSVEVDGFFAWAAADLTTGRVVASANAEEATSSTESMIKPWIVADYLRRLAEAGGEPSPEALHDASRAIRDSHNAAAERLYVAGGRDAVVRRMVEICELTNTYTPRGDEGWWSRTEMSAMDAVRLGQCLLDGRAAGDEWTDWVLSEMRQVRGTTDPRDQRPEENFEGGRWGIIDGLPDYISPDDVSIKNGWTRIGRTNSWHLNCLAITDEWVMAVMMRYPAAYPLDYGAERCAAVASQLLVDRVPARSALTTAVP